MKSKKDLLIRIAESHSNDYPHSPLVLLDGFEDAFVGVCKDRGLFQRAIYDYWKCMEVLIHEDELEFDEALDWMEIWENEDLGEGSPIFIKNI
jgi:hypothetical protein